MNENKITRIVSTAEPPGKHAFSLKEWMERELPNPDPLCGTWLTSTSRVLAFSETGAGKTLLMMALGMRCSNGSKFLHWPANSPVRVLYIDGEMSSRLLRDRLVKESERLGAVPDGFFACSWEDIANFQPLNTEQGQAAIEQIIKDHGPFGLIIFDNIISLISGNQKEEEGWQQTQPWVKSLTKRKIAQIWIHHTGHDITRSYGTKTREWQMDTVIWLEKVEHPETDVCFRINFQKARERTPANRSEFAEVTVTLLNEQWKCDAVNVSYRKAKLSPMESKFYEALLSAARVSKAKRWKNYPTAYAEEWAATCVTMGLIASTEREPMKTFYKFRGNLVAANWVANNDEVAWSLTPLTAEELEAAKVQPDLVF
jgi:hypothetical protein